MLSKSGQVFSRTLVVYDLLVITYYTALIEFWFQDNVFVNVVASIQYRALSGKASDAFYKLSNTRSQIQAYVFDGTFLPLHLIDIVFLYSTIDGNASFAFIVIPERFMFSFVQS